MLELKEQIRPVNGNGSAITPPPYQYTKDGCAMDDSQYIPPGFESQDTAKETSGGIDDHPLFSQLTMTRQEIAAVEAEMKSLKAQIGILKDEAQQIAYDALVNADSESEGLQLATHLYWLHDDLIRAQTVGNYLGTHGAGVAYRVGKAVLKLRCIDCGETVEYFPTSRSDAKYHADSGTCVCDPCNEERHSGHSRRAEEYRRQIEILRAMPYSKYLQTDHWQNLRLRMLKRAGFKCQVCNSGGQLHVHHRTYVNRGNEELKDLIVLCAACHQEFHDKMELQK